ncbi:DUF6241 domain-containing protein [Metabacillus iocasae]|uniref:PRK06770 family protein n=1 Tax=Priestia iocasae TaxID=2291674 RepID=A0ABS2QS44_9BACI|nr:DUF6241 domain-containing protein [Metabacillus iocasae]MBM7702113.1 hypothetical protein [Metabacillus iocasae]
MKKTILIAITVCILGGAAGFYGYKAYTKSSVTTTNVEANSDGTSTLLKIKEVRKQPIEDEFPIDMVEEDIQNALHGMSHQKVKAKDKWGFIPLTDDRINRLLDIVTKNKAAYKHSDTYLAILTRWQAHDFSKIDKDHNAIWKLQKGTIGKAKGILSLEEEKEFIQENVKVE